MNDNEWKPEIRALIEDDPARPDADSVRVQRACPLPRRPWVASSQYGMHFILSQDSEILWRADWVPMEMLRAMVKAANEVQVEKTVLSSQTRRDGASNRNGPLGGGGRAGC